MEELVDAVRARYDTLSQQACCLSCGGAVSHGKAESGRVCVDLGSGCRGGMSAPGGGRWARRARYGIDASDGHAGESRASAGRLG